jgi:hypothetical protein
MVKAVWEIGLDDLWRRSIRGVILDLDNTIVPWNTTAVHPEARAWIAAALQHGLRVCLLSNALRRKRVAQVARDLRIVGFTRAGKPLPSAFRRAMAALGTTADTTCAIGDQLFTDMLGANWLGITTVLVDPISPREPPHTRLVRLLERALRRRWGRQAGHEAVQGARGDRGETPRA